MRLNMEASRVKSLKPIGDSACLHPLTDLQGVSSRQGDAAVAGKGKGTRIAIRLLVHREAVRRHHPQRRPGALYAQRGQSREGLDATPGYFTEGRRIRSQAVTDIATGRAE